MDLPEDGGRVLCAMALVMAGVRLQVSCQAAVECPSLSKEAPSYRQGRAAEGILPPQLGQSKWLGELGPRSLPEAGERGWDFRSCRKKREVGSVCPVPGRPWSPTTVEGSGRYGDVPEMAEEGKAVWRLSVGTGPPADSARAPDPVPPPGPGSSVPGVSPPTSRHCSAAPVSDQAGTGGREEDPPRGA